MWPQLVLVGLGALLAGSRSPRVRCQKLDVLGPRSGRRWHAEFFPEARFLVVFGDDGTRVTFERDSSGMRYVRSLGPAATVAAIRSDFER